MCSNLRRVMILAAGVAVCTLGAPALHTHATDAVSQNLALYQRMGDFQSAAVAQNTVQNSNFTTQSVSQPTISSGTDNTVTDPATGLTTVTRELTLSQSYHSDYDMFELGLNGRFFFYSNVGNGDITYKPVKLTIPANLIYSCEKDGVPVSYVQGTEIKNLGSYVVTVVATQTTGTTTTNYVGYFRFRIMAPTEQQLQEEAQQTDTQAYDWSNPSENTADDSIYDNLTQEEQDAIAEALDNGTLTDDEIMNPDGTLNQEVIDSLVNSALESQGMDGAYTKEGINDSTGMASSYDYTSGYYINTLKNSMSFYTDVPNGMITHREVSIRTSDDLAFTVYKDGALYDMPEGDTFTEPGSYLVIPTAEDVLYYDAYQDDTPYFSFRIIGYFVNDISVYNAPEGFTVSEVLLNEVPAENVKIVGGTRAFLKEDGKYRITVTDGERSIEVEFTLDRVKPRFGVMLNKNEAIISYVTSDVENTMVYKNGELISEGTVVDRIKGKGRYELKAIDKAGNVSSASFAVRFGLNRGSIVTILIVIAFFVGMYAYLRYLNKKVRVR